MQASFSKVLANGHGQMPLTNLNLQPTPEYQHATICPGRHLRSRAVLQCVCHDETRRAVLLSRLVVIKLMFDSVQNKTCEYFLKQTDGSYSNLFWPHFFRQHGAETAKPRSRHCAMIMDIIAHWQQMLPAFCWNMFQHHMLSKTCGKHAENPRRPVAQQTRGDNRFNISEFSCYVRPRISAAFATKALARSFHV